MKIRFMRTFEGILKAQEEGYCWADLIFWLKYSEGFTWDNVGKANQCGYCGGCLPN